MTTWHTTISEAKVDCFMLGVLIISMGIGPLSHFLQDKIIPMKIKDLNVKIKT